MLRVVMVSTVVTPVVVSDGGSVRENGNRNQYWHPDPSITPLTMTDEDRKGTGYFYPQTEPSLSYFPTTGHTSNIYNIAYLIYLNWLLPLEYKLRKAV